MSTVPTSPRLSLLPGQYCRDSLHGCNIGWDKRLPLLLGFILSCVHYTFAALNSGALSTITWHSRVLEVTPWNESESKD